MIPQCKGKDLGKVPKSKLEEFYFASVKYDGNYVQIHKEGSTVKFFTSGGKEFYLSNVAAQIVKLNPRIDFKIECEYIERTSGLLGSRPKAAKLTTYRTYFSKGIPSEALSDERFMVFDIIIEGLTFTERLKILKKIQLPKFLWSVTHRLGTLNQFIEEAKDVVKLGYEGLYLKSPDHLYSPGKRVNDAIKLKVRPTVDLLCIDILPGEGKYIGMIGSLVLQDKRGRIVKVGSGLTDEQRIVLHSNYLGKVIEIEYEQILDTYIQPTYIGVRADKTKEEID